MKKYINIFLEFNEYLSKFKKSINENVFIDKKIITDICFLPLYCGYFIAISRIYETIELFGIEFLDRNKEALSQRIRCLGNSSSVSTKSSFEYYVDDLITLFFTDDIMEQITTKLSILSSEEIVRLNEAIHCYVEGCNYASVAMSVSAVESRLLSLLSSINSDLDADRLTLGQLISEYTNNKEQYREVIPRKHEPLLDLCNTYRIFSVHPKKEIISKSVADSILHLSFEFLLDKEMTVE